MKLSESSSLAAAAAALLRDSVAWLMAAQRGVGICPNEEEGKVLRWSQLLGLRQICSPRDGTLLGTAEWLLEGGFRMSDDIIRSAELLPL